MSVFSGASAMPDMDLKVPNMVGISSSSLLLPCLSTLILPRMFISSEKAITGLRVRVVVWSGVAGMMYVVLRGLMVSAFSRARRSGAMAMRNIVPDDDCP